MATRYSQTVHSARHIDGDSPKPYYAGSTQQLNNTIALDLVKYSDSRNFLSELAASPINLDLQDSTVLTTKSRICSC